VYFGDSAVECSNVIVIEGVLLNETQALVYSGAAPLSVSSRKLLINQCDD